MVKGGRVRIEGWKAIAARVGRGKTAVQRWAQLKNDPLPVRVHMGRRWIYEDVLRAWMERNGGWDCVS